jgi:hypothetical protein
MALQPMVLDYHVLAFDIAQLAEAPAERGHKTRGGIGRPTPCPLIGVYPKCAARVKTMR